MSDDSVQLGQDEIEKLLSQSTRPAGPAETPAAIGQSDIDALLGGKAPGGAPPATARSSSGTTEIAQQDIEFLLSQAEQALESVDRPQASPTHSPATPFRLEEFGRAPASSEHVTLHLLRDVELDLRIELGRADLPLAEVLKLRKGAVVTLDRMAGDPVDIYVNGRLIARGEVLVMNENFCVRVAELITTDQLRAG